MPVMASKSGGGTFTPHPEGQFVGVCVDVHDVGLVAVTFQGHTKQQHKVDLYFFCDEWRDSEKGERWPATVRERFTLTLDDRGRLRPFLESWRGQAFTEEEEEGFDLEKLIGAPAFLQIIHNESNGKVYANIKTIMKLPKGMARLEVPAEYVRVKDRPPRDNTAQNGNGTTNDAAPTDFDDDSDMPF